MKQQVLDIAKATPMKSWGIVFGKKKANKELYDWMKTNYPNLTISETIYWLENTLTEHPKCVCGKETKYQEYTTGYRKYCSVKCGSSAEETKNQRKATSLERYGTEVPWQSAEIKAKARKTMKEKYGGETTLSSSLKQKVQETNLERYGHITPAKNTVVKDKIKSTINEKYGVENIQYLRYQEETRDVLLNDKRFKDEYFDLGPFGMKTKYQVSMQMIRLYCQKYNIEHEARIFKTEEQVKLWLDSIGVKYELNNRTAIPPKELDFYLPEQKIGIEVCGLYWHSEIGGKRDRAYHLDKLRTCTNNGIKLITIFEDELNGYAWQHRLKHALGFAETLTYARKCKIREIDVSSARKFCDTYHTQRYTPATTKIGAFYNNTLVAVMTFGNSRYSKYEIEMLRFCTSANIPGIGSKLFKFYIDNNNPKSIISYCDLRWGTGNFYEKLGFTYSHDSKPSYWYMKNYQEREHRSKYQKHKIKPGNLTEWEYMQQNGYDRIWDCGNSVWVMHLGK